MFLNFSPAIALALIVSAGAGAGVFFFDCASIEVGSSIVAAIRMWESFIGY